MKREIYDYMLRAGKIRRRDVLKGVGATGTLAAFSGVSTGISVRPAWAVASAFNNASNSVPKCSLHR